MLRHVIVTSVFLQGWMLPGLAASKNLAGDLKERSYHEVAWLSAHNAFNNREDGWAINNNQLLGFERQYKNGVRAFFLDLYWYAAGSLEKSYVAMCHEDKEQVGLFWGGCPLSYLALGLSPPPKLETFLEKVSAWLRKDPNAIVTLHLESQLGKDSKEPLNILLKKAKLSQYVYQGPEGVANKPVVDWPKLSELIRLNQRLVIFSDSSSDGFIGVNAYRETNYNLAESPHCEMRPDGRSFTAKLFVLNHFYAFPLSSVRDFIQINSFEAISARIVQCCQKQGRLPNFVVLDFVEQGEGRRIVDLLNQLDFSQPDPDRCGSLFEHQIRESAHIEL